MGVIGSGFLVMMVKAAEGGEEPEESICNRLATLALNSVTMMAAWCILWATRWIAVKFPNMYGLPSMTGSVILAVEATILVGCVIFILDKIDDTIGDPKASSVAIKTMINALGVLVGFSWEHCFDFGVTSIASRTANAPLAKLAMAIITMVFIVPAWRRHVLFKVMILQKIDDGRNAEPKKTAARSILAEADDVLPGPAMPTACRHLPCCFFREGHTAEAEPLQVVS